MLLAKSPVELQSYEQEQGPFIYTTVEGVSLPCACDSGTELEGAGGWQRGKYQKETVRCTRQRRKSVEIKTRTRSEQKRE
jgi:hypothetical protein